MPETFILSSPSVTTIRSISQTPSSATKGSIEVLFWVEFPYAFVKESSWIALMLEMSVVYCTPSSSAVSRRRFNLYWTLRQR